MESNNDLDFIERKRFLLFPGDKVRVTFVVQSPTWVSISSALVSEAERTFEMSVDL